MTQGAILLGVNYGALGPSAAAHADLSTIYADLSSRSAIPIVSSLDATTVYPGVWNRTLFYTLGSRASVTFDARNNPDAVFIMINSGEGSRPLALHACLCTSRREFTACFQGICTCHRVASCFSPTVPRCVCFFIMPCNSMRQSTRVLEQATNIYWVLGSYCSLESGSVAVSDGGVLRAPLT